MDDSLFSVFKGQDVTDDMLQAAAELFNGNYGVWGNFPQNPKPGSPVKLSKSRLRSLYLPQDVDCTYARVTVNDQLAGNAFACRWITNDRIVCWITQLVVHKEFRERGLAAGLLNHLRRDNDTVYGLMSSHPAACLAAGKAFGNGIGVLRFRFLFEHAASIMQDSPIKYVRDAKLRGSLFDPDDTSGAVACVFTDFFVDHRDPLQALEWVRKDLEWPLGDLLDGHEFLYMTEIRYGRRNKGSSSSSSWSRS